MTLLEELRKKRDESARQQSQIEGSKMIWEQLVDSFRKYSGLEMLMGSELVVMLDIDEKGIAFMTSFVATEELDELFSYHKVFSVQVDDRNKVNDIMDRVVKEARQEGIEGEKQVDGTWSFIAKLGKERTE